MRIDYEELLIEALIWLEREHVGAARKFCQAHEIDLDSEIYDIVLARVYPRRGRSSLWVYTSKD